jgi:type I restriction enzyme S subunit
MSVENLITEHLDIWTSAIKTKSAAGRGSSKKLELVGVKKLRELILELAVRGKLVPQDPNDEPASELLKKIEVEKTRLIKAGKIKKQKPLPPITDEEKTFELPKGWEWQRWNNLALKIGDIDHKMPSEELTGYPYVSPRDFYPNNVIKFENAKKISREDFEKLAAKIQPQRGDIIFPRYGTIGANVLVDTDIDFLASYSCCVIKTLHGRINSDFQFIFSISPFVKEQCRKAENRTTQPNVGIKSIQEFVFPLPPFEEQNRIVAKVDELMVLCDQLEAQTESSIDAHKTLVEVLLATLTDAKDADELNENWQTISQHFDVLFTTQASIDQLKQTILQLAVMGKLVKQDPNDEPASKLLERIATEKQQLIKDGKIKKQKPLPPISDGEKPFALPTGWEWVILQEITSKITDGDHQTPPRITSGFKLLSAKNVRDGYVDMDICDFIAEEHFIKSRERCLPEEGDLMIVSVGGTIGRSSVVPKDSAFALVRSVALIKLLKISPFYFKYAMDSQLLQESIHARKRGGAQPCLYLSEIGKFPFSLPPLTEQHRIVAKVDELIALCDSLKINLNQAQTTQLQLTDAIVEQAL